MMNRSYRSQDSQLEMEAAVIKQRQQLRASMLNRNKNNNNKEKEEEQLELFLEMNKSENDQTNLLLFLNTSPDDFDAPLGSKPGISPIFNISSSTTTTPAPARKAGGDDFLNSENDKNDYEWLLTPPDTPLFPSLETESQKTIMSQLGAPKSCPPALKSRLANPQPEAAARSFLVSKQSVSFPGLNSSGNRWPSSSAGPGSRPTTPTSRPTLPSTTKPSRSSTPTSRASLPSKTMLSTSKSAVTATKPTAPPAKPTVPAAKPTVPAAKPIASSAKPTVPARSSTPTRSTPRPSTPTTRASMPPSMSTSRAATPTRRPSTPSSASSSTVPMSSIKPSPSVTKPASTTRNPVPSRGTSPVKSRTWKPSDVPGFSLDIPPNLRTSAPERPISATRGRPGAASSISAASNGRSRRQCCSPSRGRTPNGIMHTSGSSVPAINRLHAKANDSVSPVLIGTKMVERVINMRKLAPPRQDDKHSPHSNLSGKSSSPDSSGFGRTLSKKSLDMAMRHMDIRRSIPGNSRPLMNNIPASSLYSMRSGPTRGRTVSVSDSLLATSSNASSEVSVNNNGLCLDAIQLQEEIGSERGGRSPLRGS